MYDDEELRECAYHDCEALFEPSVHNQKYHSLSCKRAQRNARRRKEMVSDIADAVSKSYMYDDDEDFDEDEHFEFLRKENRRLANLYQKHKHNTAEVVQSVYQAAYDALSRVDIKPVSPPKKDRRTADEEVCNPWWSDWQLGKITKTYNSEIGEERVNLFTDKVLHITDIQRADHPVKHARIYALGDMVEGEDIFSGQHWLIDEGVLNQVLRCVELMADNLRRFLSHFDTVSFVGVRGNHGHVGGRNHRYYHPDTNFDTMVYKFLEMLFEDENRIDFDTPYGEAEANYYTVDYVGDYGTLLIHGDQMPKPTSYHTYFKKVNGWAAGAIDQPFNDVAMGHYHQNTKITVGEAVLRISGSTESDNMFAQKTIGVQGRPSQHLQFLHPRQGVTAEYDIYLDEV